MNTVKPEPAIYRITNVINTICYIGSASNVRERWHHHRYYLRRNAHNNPHLQRAWNKYGEGAFQFSVIEYVDLDKLLVREQIHLDEEFKKHKTYNILTTAGRPTGHKHTDEAKQKISSYFKENHHYCWRGRKHSDETKEKIRAANIGKVVSKETAKKISVAKLGKPNLHWKPMSDNTRKKLSETKIRNGCNRGEKNHNSRITERDVHSIRSEYESGASIQTLAHKYNMTHSGMSNVVHRRSWKHV